MIDLANSKYLNVQSLRFLALGLDPRRLHAKGGNARCVLTLTNCPAAPHVFAALLGCNVSKKGNSGNYSRALG